MSPYCMCAQSLIRLTDSENCLATGKAHGFNFILCSEC